MATTVESPVVAPTEGGPGMPTKPVDPFVSRYRTFCYRLLGQRFDSGEGQEAIAERLQRAGMNITPGMHYSVETFTAVIAAVIGFAVSFLLFFVGLHSTQWFLYVLVITAIAVGATVGGFNFLLTSRIANRKDELERELPFTLSELSVLASTGSSPIRLGAADGLP